MRRVAALLEKSGRAVFFVITQVHNCKILAHSETFQHLGNNPTRLLFHSFFLSKTHLILLSPIDTPQKTPPIVCFLKKRRAIVCTLGYESKKSCTRFFECMILTLYHQRYDCGGGDESRTHAKHHKNRRNYVIFLFLRHLPRHKYLFYSSSTFSRFRSTSISLCT